MIERRVSEPILPLSIFRQRTLAGANIAGLLLGGSFFAFIFVGTLYMQQVLHYSALQTGVAWLAASLTSIALAGLSQLLVTRVGAKPVMAVGMTLIGAGIIWATQVPVHGHFLANLAGPMGVAGAGTAFSFIPISIAALAGVEERRAGLASGLLNTSEQLGGAIGIAIASSVAASHTKALAHAGNAVPVALTGGFQHAMWVLGAIALISLPAIFVLVGRRELAPAASATAGPDRDAGQRRSEARASRDQLTTNQLESRKETQMSSLTDKTTIVVGASRGLGRGIATAFAQAGASVVAVARTGQATGQVASRPGAIRDEIADAGEPTVAAGLLDRHEPDVIVLVAGATPYMRPLQQQTWDTFSVNWQTDVRIAFHWLREALLKPLAPGSRVVVFSSGAALNPNGSPLSGGYAGAKATQRLITVYAQEEANRAGLGITFTTVLPQFAPETGVGRPAVAAYAAQAGLPVDEFLQRQPFQLLTPEIAGAALVELVRSDPAALAPAYLLNGAGLQKLP